MDRETRRLKLQADLDSKKTPAERNKLGQFATPTRLALEVVQSALLMLGRQEQIRFLDPAFGTGSFYSALLESAAERVETARAFEIDPHYGDSAVKLWAKTTLDLKIADFTKAKPTASSNFLICNPPYVRHHHLSQNSKADLREAIGRHFHFNLSGLSGLYCYFLVLSTAWLTKGGVAAWLIPSEFMDVNYGQKVKQFLLDHVTLERIHRFDPNEGQFDDALVSSAVVFFRNEKPKRGHRVSFTFGGSLKKPKITSRVTRNELEGIGKWTSLPHKAAAGRVKSAKTLSDLFKIQRGIATGCNEFFLLTPEKNELFKIPKQFLKPILPSPRYLDSDVIEADRNGNPIVAKKLFLLSCDLPEAEVRAKHPSLWKYLQTGIDSGISERYLCKHRRLWYSQENRPAAPFVLTYMGRPSSKSAAPFRFILNRSKATAANVYLMLYPKPGLAKVIDSNPVALEAIWRGLSGITGEMFTDEGRIYGGGLHKIEPRELANVSADFVFNALGEDVNWKRQQELFAD